MSRRCVAFIPRSRQAGIMTASRLPLPDTTRLRSGILIKLLALEHVKGVLGQVARHGPDGTVNLVPKAQTR